MFSSTLVTSVQVNALVSGIGDTEEAIGEMKDTLRKLGYTQDMERYGFGIVKELAEPLPENPEVRKVSVLFGN